ncbi:MAG: winged helix-turn-helix domain-containing protein [Betaproteobacteria bacterium]|nr:winged helix-turn-helix domain-containing protein [Betaproteobacteria bacterium]
MPDDANPTPPTRPAAGWRFGPYEARPTERALLADGVPVKLGGRAFDTLVALLERHERVVGKRELMDTVWPKLVVEENNLQAQVMALRKVMGPAAIATVPGRGYRLTLPVESIGAPARSAAPVPAAAAAPRPTNVPANLPPMLGRADDLEALAALVRAHGLVSIVGAGGIGKTRLAHELLADLADDWPDGAWLVELSSLADPALVASAVARVVGATVPVGRPATDAVAAVLRTQRMVLALDNCEHLLDGVVAFVEALRTAASGVRLLVTSQEPLKAVDEHVYRLATLSVPPADAADAAGYSAVEMFVAAARAADPRFALTRRNAAAVAEICRHLDGIPLALQLAAARVPLLGIEGLRARLTERFHVLTGGARTVLRRHQTLRGALEWSHGLLTAEEQAVFRRLSVFAGTFTLVAAQQVAADATLSDWQVLEHLGALVDKSLVVAEGEDTPRYRLLETTRAFALERLGEAGETDEFLRRHAVATRDAIQHLARNPWRTTLADAAALGMELDNLRAAIAWAIDNDDERLLAIELHVAGARVWGATALLAEGLAHCLDARRRVDGSLPPATHAQFLQALATMGTYTARIECLEAAQDAARRFLALAEPRLAFDALTKVAAIGARRGALAEVAAALDEAERLEDPAWPARQRAQTRFARFMWCTMDGRYDEALAFARAQQALYRADGSVVGEQLAAGNAAAALAAMGQPEAALAEVESAYARLLALGAGALAGHVLGTRMLALLALGRHDEAREWGRAAQVRLQREGDALWLLEPLALAAAQQERPADAARIVGHVDARIAATGDVRRAPARARRARIDALLAAGLPDDERRALFAAGATLREDEAFALALGASA